MQNCKRIKTLKIDDRFEAGTKSRTSHDDRKELPKQEQRRQGGWCWLLNQDGTPSIVGMEQKAAMAVKSSGENEDRKRAPEASGESPSPAEHTRKRKANGNSSRSLATKKEKGVGVAMAVKSSGENEDRKRAPGTLGESPSPVTRKRKSNGSSSRNLATKKEKRSYIPDAAPSSTDSTTKEAMREKFSSTVHEGGVAPPTRPGWHWLLAPDGSPATAGTARTPTISSTQQRKPNVEANPGRELSEQTQPQLSLDEEPTDGDETDNNYQDSEFSDSNTEDGSSDESSIGEDSCSDEDSCANQAPSNYRNRRWEEKFQLLVQYKKEHKTTLVPVKDWSLGSWVDRQRCLYRNKKMPKYRVQRLNSVGFIWSAENIRSDRRWEENFQRLVQYKKEHKTTLVPAVKGCSFGCWVYDQRKRYRTKKMPKYRMERLNSIGFIWSNVMKIKGDKRWDDNFQRLVRYKEVHKTTKVPQEYGSLHHWVKTQRNLFNSKKLSKCRVQRLNSVGFVWRAFEETPTWWMEMYNQLLSYEKQHNSSTYEPGKLLELRRWVNLQRNNYKQGKLSNERIALLEYHRFKWETLEVVPWMEMYQRLKAYKEKHKNTRVPHDYLVDRKLGKWVQNQRTGCKEKDHIALLDEVEFEWRTDEQIVWETMYNRLLKYKNKYGHTCVPYSNVPDPELGKWVTEQRRQCKEKDLVDRLNKIGFTWNISKGRDMSWLYNYYRLSAYKKKNGTMARLEKDSKLYMWVEQQRHRCDRRDRIDLLNKIGFVWDEYSIWV